MAENDVKFAVASLGTTLSKTQILKMWNYSNVPYICFDGDEAGRESSKRIAVKILEFLVPGKSFKFIKLPENYDPDSFFKKWNKKYFDELVNKSYYLSDLIWQIILESVEKPTPEFIALLDEKIKYYSSKILNKTVSEEYYRFFIKKKNDFVWNLKSRKKKNFVIKEKVQVFTNEKLIIVFLIFENKLIQNFLEEISCLKFKDQKLEKIKDSLFKKIFIEKIKDEQEFIQQTKSQLFFYEEINLLYKTHLGGLNDEEKLIFFQQILTNLKLPDLQSEGEKLKKLIINTNDNDKQAELISKYNKILDEIKTIKNKELE